MRKSRMTVLAGLSAVWLAACGGGGGGSTEPPGALPPTPEPASTYSVTLLAVDADRSADQQPMPLDGLPHDGATLTVP